MGRLTGILLGVPATHQCRTLNDMNTSTNMDDAKAAWEKVQEYSWDYLAVINFGHYIANYAWNDHVKGLNNYSGLYFWNAGYVE
ncbi:hypothetical protein KHX12_01190 [butyrate-producing bacterium]|nr:hypothetical protein [butyrate-producing bacterium]